jgi:hypothetical protein
MAGDAEMVVGAYHRAPLHRLVHRPVQVFNVCDTDIVKEQLPLAGWNVERG